MSNILKTYDLGKIVGDAGTNGEKGEQGNTGAQGAAGKKAYLYAVEAGYTGTEEQFASDLAQVGQKVDNTRTINGKALTSDISLGASDVGALPANQKGTPSGVATLDAEGKVPRSQLPFAAILPKLIVAAPDGVTVTATDGDTTVSDVASDGVAELTVTGFGVWHLSCYFSSVNETITKKVNVDAVKIYHVSLSTDFSEMDWEEIIRLKDNTSLIALWNIGDSHDLMIGKDKYEAEIIGKGKDTYFAGGTAPVTFALKQVYLPSVAYTDVSSTMNAVFNKLPDELKAEDGIKSVEKKTATGPSQYATSNNKLFLLSESELGIASLSYGGDGAMYDRFTLAGYIGRVREDIKERERPYWLRSISKTDSSKHLFVNTNGLIQATASTAEYGILFAFCI